MNSIANSLEDKLEQERFPARTVALLSLTLLLAPLLAAKGDANAEARRVEQQAASATAALGLGTPSAQAGTAMVAEQQRYTDAKKRTDADPLDAKAWQEQAVAAKALARFAQDIHESEAWARLSANAEHSAHHARWKQAAKRYNDSAKALAKSPKDPASLMAHARAADDLSEMAILHSSRAAYVQSALASLDALSGANQADIAALGKEARAHLRQRFAVDFDMAELGAGTDRVDFDFLPLRFLFTKHGTGLVVHTLFWQLQWDPKASVKDDKRLIAIYAPEAFELEQRLLETGRREGFNFWPPFFGHGASVNAYALACPWALSQIWYTSESDPRIPGDNPLCSEFVKAFALAQYYEAGLRLDSRPLLISGGYSWALAQADPGVSYATYFCGWFAKVELRWL
jgi:hypothetical protein